MIHPQITAFAETFERESHVVFSRFPALTLDGTWPSIGVVDLLLFNLRGKDELSSDEVALLQGAAAYIGRFLYGVWSEFKDGSRCELTLGENSDIQLTLQGGKFLETSERVVLSLSATLSAILREIPSPLPVFEDYRFPITPFDNLLSPVVAGIATTITPYAQGPLATKRIYELAAYVMSAHRVLAESSARHYKRLHVGEEHGQNPELYMSGLIYPPPGYDEKFAFCRSAVGIVEFFAERELPSPEIEQCAYNLAISPDALIATTGFVVLAALAQGSPSPSLVALSESKRLQIQRLRPAVVAARQALGIVHDWVALADEGHDHEATSLAACESRLGLLPLLQARSDIVIDRRLRKLCHAIAWNDVAGGAHESVTVLQTTQYAPDPALQAIYFDIAAGNLESAELGLNAIKQRYHDTPDVLARALRLSAQCAMFRRDWSEARALLQNALRFDVFDASTRCVVLNELAYVFVLNGDGAGALPLLDESLALEPYHVTQRLNRVAALQMIGRDEDAAREAAAVAHYAPTDPRVFELIRTLVIPDLAPTQH